MNKSVQFITRTAILLALTVLFQSLRVLVPIPANISQYVIGSLVNLSLIVAAVIIGIKGGLIIAIIAPILAFIQGFAPPFPIMIVLIMLSNVVLVAVVALLYKKSPVLAVGLGAVLKFIALFIGVVNIAVPFLLIDAPEKVKATLSVQFSWPQLVTAAIGGILALGILTLVMKAIKE